MKILCTTKFRDRELIGPVLEGSHMSKVHNVTPYHTIFMNDLLN